MTNKEWRRLCREVKNQGDYFVFQKVISHFMRYFKARELKTFIRVNTYQGVLNWYISYYKRKIK